MYKRSSLVEHLRQHELIAVADRSIQERALAFHIDEKPPSVSQFIVGPTQSDSPRTADDMYRDVKTKQLHWI